VQPNVYSSMSESNEAIRQYASSLNQLYRMFGHHRDSDTIPEEPEKQIGAERTDEELEDVLKELESDDRC